ncbi:phosphatase PAP2 family protein [Agaribacterium sp. ZY112]|uniref:phosphatase PAP2 family protein n=1 Tax=Agaribacterium sp. ZY112 TaxID=3233574 RepID=UPI00352613BA
MNKPINTTPAPSLLSCLAPYGIGAAFVACLIFFLVFPNLDIDISAYFYDNGFYWNDNLLIRAIYWFFAKIHALILLVLIALCIYYAKKHRRNDKLAAVFLLSSLILGPGILVNLVLKDNSLGRPRPVHVQEFGGDANYSKPLYYSGECKRNCSFVSGHASIGFYLMALYWINRKKRWLIGGIALGLAIGLTRIMQGGHFFSDVILAGWAVYFVCVGLDKLILNRRSHTASN